MNPIFTITNAITRDLTLIERARGFLDAATLSDEWVRRMRQRVLLLEACHTTHIEGTQLTLEQSQAVWDGHAVTEANADEVREFTRNQILLFVGFRGAHCDSPPSGLRN